MAADLGEFKHMWGYGTSPVIHEDRVILHSGPGKRVFIAAFALADGKELWRSEEPINGDGEYRLKDESFDKGYMGSWCTPIIVKLDGKLQAVCTMPTRVVSYDVNDGSILWTCDGIRGPGDLAYSSPVSLATFVWSPAASAGRRSLSTPADRDRFPKDSGSGRRSRTRRASAQAWLSTATLVVRCRPQYDCVYRAGVRQREVDPRAGNYWGSIVCVGGRCYATGQDGTTTVFRPSPEKFEVLAENTLGEGSNATPAISDGDIFLPRTRRCIAWLSKRRRRYL